MSYSIFFLTKTEKKKYSAKSLHNADHSQEVLIMLVIQFWQITFSKHPTYLQYFRYLSNDTLITPKTTSEFRSDKF